MHPNLRDDAVQLALHALLRDGDNCDDAVRVRRRDIGKTAREIGGEGRRGFFIRDDSDKLGISVGLDAYFAVFVG